MKVLLRKMFVVFMVVFIGIESCAGELYAAEKNKDTTTHISANEIGLTDVEDDTSASNVIEITLKKGYYKKLTAITTLTDLVKWNVGDQKVATISTNEGISIEVYAKSVGTTTITCMVNGKPRHIWKVTVEGSVEIGTQKELESNWKYIIKDNWVKLQGYIGTNPDVKICGKYKVNNKVYNTDVGGAFDCKDDSENDGIRSIVVGYGCSADNVIGCFDCMKNLIEIDIQELNIYDGGLAYALFSNNESLQSLKIGSLTGVTSLSQMMRNCPNIHTLDLRGINTDTLSFDMCNMFDGCTNLQTIDISTFNTSKVRDMSYAFAYCPNLKTIYVGSGWKVPSRHRYMFRECGTQEVTYKEGIAADTGFDYTKDGFCFLNNATAFFYKRLSDGSYGCGDYVIPKERFDDLYGGCPESYYEDQKSQFTYKYSEGKTNFKGYCFGMTNVAARIYNGQIDIENFSGIRNYDKGVTVNEKLYDGIATGTNSQAVLLMDGDRKLAEEIEKYWLWQICTTNLGEWESNNNLPLADVMRDWKKRCYLIGYSYKDENNETHGHSVLTNTASPVPKCERDKDGREYYRIPIYDPNYPAFTDENNESYDELIKNSTYGNGQRYITVYADGSGFKTDDGENGSEICIIDVNSMPQDINGSCNFEEPRYVLEQDLNNLGDKIGAKLKIRSRKKEKLLGTVDIYNGTLEKVYDPKLKLYRLQVVHGNGDSRKYEITYDGDFNDLIFEVEGECHCTAIYGGNIQSVRLNGKGEFSFSEEKVNVNAVDSVKASIMMSSVKNDVVDDGAIANITLDSGEGAQFTLNDQKQYQVVSDDKIDSTVKVYGESENSGKPSENVSASKKQKISVAKFKKTYSAKKLEQKKVILKLKAKSSGKGKISYKILKGKKNDITVSKNGTVTLKKGCKKGTYKILISANRKGVYKKAKKVITLKVRD